MTSPTDTPTAPANVSLPAVLAVQLGVAITTIDISLTSTAVPTIAAGIGASPASAIWIINVYYLTVIAAIFPLAALGEIHGHRRIFFSGLVVFAVGSLAEGLSTSLPMLAVARGVLGLGAAAVSATCPALIRAIYPPSGLGRGLGIYAMVVGIAFSVGPMATSAILSVASWRWLFLMHVPLALLIFLIAKRDLPQTERNIRPFDALSALLCAALFASLLFGIASIAHRANWVPVVCGLTLAAICAVGLRWREAGQAAPILAVDLFRIPLFALSSATSICAFSIQGLVFVVLPFMFQFEFGYSAVQAGFLITPWPATLAAMTFIAAPLGDRIHPGLLCGVGLLIVALGIASILTLPAAPSVIDIVWRLMLCGFGFGLFQSPNMKAIMSSAPVHRSGGAAGILAASRLLGQSTGAAIVAICLSLFAMYGIWAAIWAGVAIAVFGSTVSFLRLLPSVRLRI